jgi:myo-inositol 2-dehydrogenase/D-chiro-inositol 1-dehydrogenase
LERSIRAARKSTESIDEGLASAAFIRIGAERRPGGLGAREWRLSAGLLRPFAGQDQIGVAVLGAGRMAQIHFHTLASMPSVQVIVVADPNREAAEIGRLTTHARRSVADPNEAIDDPEVQVVLIVTPTTTHASLIEASIRAGKAVWSEKPIALDIAETARVVDLAKSTGVPVQIGFMRRFDPGYRKARETIVSGALGRLETFRALSRDTYPPSLNFLRTSGGLFLDMAVHDLDLARFLVGEVEDVEAWGSVLIDERFARANDVDTAVTMLRFRNGALGVVETSRRSAWGYDVRTEVAGALGKVVIEAPQKTQIVYSREFGFEGDHFENFPDRFETAYRRELESFFGALAAGRMPEPGPAEALETLRLAVAVTLSWREGRQVRVADVTG